MRMIVGITGTDGSGKGAVVDYLLSEKGFTHYSARALLEKELERQGIGKTRTNMRLVANDLRARNGDDFIVRLSLERAKAAGDTNIVIESIRAVAEATALVNAGGILVAVDADQELRYERVQSRRSSSDKVSFEEFKKHEELEKNDPDPHGMQKAKVMEMAACTIENNGTFEELHQEIEEKLVPLLR